VLKLPDEAGMLTAYIDAISLIKRLHRRFLEVVDLELDRFGIQDINNIQAVMLFNIGDAEMTVGEIISRGCYIGTNASYNIGKMVNNGYFSQETSPHDRRYMHVRLTDKGRALRNRLNERHRSHIEMLAQTRIGESDQKNVVPTLPQLEQFWRAASDLAPRIGDVAA
jgi:DNA-binding MarR family transcriptional regulator